MLEGPLSGIQIYFFVSEGNPSPASGGGGPEWSRGEKKCLPNGLRNNRPPFAELNERSNSPDGHKSASWNPGASFCLNPAINPPIV